MNTKKAIVFDFDGVVANTAHECYIVCVKTFRQMGEEIKDSGANEKKFMILRPYVRFADDFYPVMKLIQAGKYVRNITLSNFKNLRKKYDKESKKFHDIFYENREMLKKTGIKKWIALNRSYPGTVSAVRKLSKKYRIMIATNKDLDSTFRILNHLKTGIKRSDIIPKEFSLTKADKIRKISKKLKIPLKDIIFIEDVLENLEEVKKKLPAVKLALVEWGYSTPEQRRQARKMGIKIIRHVDIEQQLEKIL